MTLCVADADWFCIAGIVRKDAIDGAPCFAMLTTQPGPDVAPYHDRQVVVLRPADWGAWLDLTRPEAELLRPLRAVRCRRKKCVMRHSAWLYRSASGRFPGRYSDHPLNHS